MLARIRPIYLFLGGLCKAWAVILKIDDFTEFKTGQLVPIDTSGGQNFAFVPGPILTTFRMSVGLWPLVAKARDAVARLEQIRGILPHPMLLLRPLQQREAIRSSSIEGTHTLPEELLLFDALQEGDDAIRIPRSTEKNERLEVWNLYEALRRGHNWQCEGKPLDKSFIAYMHKVLMTGVRGKDKNPGRFRTVPVAVGRRPRKFIPAPHDQIERLLDDLSLFMTTCSDEQMDPLVRAFIVHYQFEAIHPFEDGNGRVGRVLLSLCISRWLEFSLPWLYLSEYFERNRQEYTERLYNISTNGEWDEWIEFCMQGAIEESKSAVLRCDHLRLIRDKYNSIYGQLSSRIHKIVDLLFERPVLIISQVAEACGVSDESARQDLYKLVEAGVLKILPKTRPKAFACFEIMRVAYGDSSQMSELQS